MRNPNVVLSNLSSKALDKSYKFERLYRNLFNPEFLLMAYSNISSKEGNMTPGIDGKTIDGMSIERIQTLTDKLKNETYQPKPVRRVHIPKKDGKTLRPLGLPSIEDKIVQEAVRIVLEAIYEPTFSTHSHGFRPNRSCHTALDEVKHTFIGVRWFVEGDIKGFFDNIDHHTLISLLRKRIDDEKFIRLIWKFLRAGYVNEWKFNKTYSGTPQGGVVSPILANIYLNELDHYMEEYTSQFNTGVKRKLNPAYARIRSKRERLIVKLRDKFAELTPEERRTIQQQIREYENEKRKLPYGDPMDPNFKRVTYVRYADDFLIGIHGSKSEANRIKVDIANFLKEQLKLELSMDKTLITHSNTPAKFLGFEVLMVKHNQVIRHGQRVGQGSIYLRVPHEAWVGKLISLGSLKIKSDGTWKSWHRAELEHLDDLEILRTFNSHIRGFYNYYKIANNANVVHKFFHIMNMSMLKTVAGKYRTSVAKIARKYIKQGVFSISYQTRKGNRTATLFNGPFVRVDKGSTYNFDRLPNTLMYSAITSLTNRLKAKECEWCGNHGVDLEMHHVRKLKDLKGKVLWEKIMIARNRKTMALCTKCHDDLHAGRLD